MTGWLVLGIYALGYIGSFIKVQPALLYSVVHDEPDAADRIMSSALAGIVCLLWPLCVPLYGLQCLAKRLSAREREVAISERELEVSEREYRIARLERELGIGKSE